MGPIWVTSSMVAASSYRIGAGMGTTVVRTCCGIGSVGACDGARTSMVGTRSVGSASITTSATVSGPFASGDSTRAGVDRAATENSIGASTTPDSRCLAVRGVDAPGRRDTVLPARDRPRGELGSSVRGSTGPGRGEPVPLDFCAAPFDFAAAPFAAGGCTPPPPGRDPARLEAWGTPLSTRSSVGAARREGQRTRHVDVGSSSRTRVYGPSVARAVARSPSTSTTTVTVSPASA